LRFVRVFSGAKLVRRGIVEIPDDRPGSSRRDIGVTRFAAEANKRERREKAIAKAQAAFDEAERDHDARIADIEADRAVVEKRAQDEAARWGKQKDKLAAALRRARTE
jgi:colicin import membrane protein